MLDRDIVKIVVTLCQILRLKFTEIDFVWGFAIPPMNLFLRKRDGCRRRVGKGGKSKEGDEWEGRGGRKEGNPYVYL